MRRGGRHTQQAVDILCNSSWYVLQTLVSVAGLRFAWLARRRKGVFFVVCRACKWSEWSIFGVCRTCKGSERIIFGLARAASEEKGGFFAVARCANLLRGSFFIVSRAANYQRGSFFTLCTSCKLSARVLFHSLHELQALCEGSFLFFTKGIKGYN